MCVFCKIIAGEIPSRKVYENDHVLAILDNAQVTYGHTLVMPKKHVADFLEADDETLSECASVCRKVGRKIVQNVGAAGVNLLSNCGEAAGQSVTHLHFHIIPRYDETDAIVIKFNAGQDIDPDEVLAKVTAD